MPTPEPSPQFERRYSSSGRPHHHHHHHRGRSRIYPRVNSDISLSTISEEPTQYSSHEIIVKPEVVVETTTLPGTCNENIHNMQQRHESGGNGGGYHNTTSASSNTGTVATTSFYNSDSSGRNVSIDLSTSQALILFVVTSTLVFL